MKATLTFWNGTDGATGSEFMLDIGSKRLLIDCGLTQGVEHLEARNKEDFQYNPGSVDVLLVTHAHMDHIGRIPKLVRDGFRGKIISTTPTKALAELMFRDALKVMSIHEKEWGEEPLYKNEDVLSALELWETHGYHEVFQIGEVSVEFKDAGHILGSALVSIKGPEKEIVFSGDLGNTPHDLLRDTEFPTTADYIVMESVYGDRNHEERESRSREFARIVKEALARKGTLLIPVFSLERSQDILFELNNLVESKLIPEVPVFLDSPLAIDVTEVYRKHFDWMNESVQKKLKEGDDIFAFPGLMLTYTKDESKEIGDVPNPKIIVAGSGMSHGGRIQYHEIEHLSDPSTTILFVGYQIPGSVGRRILDGEKRVKIMKRDIKVRARVESILSYSAHKDSDHLQEFAASAPNLKELFVVLGEPKSRMFLAQRLREYHGIKATLPERREKFEIEL